MPKAIAPRKETDDYTLQEFADEIRVSLGTVKNLIRDGELVKYYPSPGTVAISVEEAERFKKSRRTSADSH